MIFWCSTYIYRDVYSMCCSAKRQKYKKCVLFWKKREKQNKKKKSQENVKKDGQALPLRYKNKNNRQIDGKQRDTDSANNSLSQYMHTLHTHAHSTSYTHPITSPNGDVCVPLLREEADIDDEENAVSLVNTNTKLTVAITQQQKQFNTANNNKKLTLRIQIPFKKQNRV